MTEEFVLEVNVIKKKGKLTSFKNRRISFEKDSIQFHGPNIHEAPRSYHCTEILYKPLKPVQGSLKVVINLQRNTAEEIAFHLLFQRHSEQFIGWVIDRFNQFIEENKDKMKPVRSKPFVPLNARNSASRENENQSIIGGTSKISKSFVTSNSENSIRRDYPDFRRQKTSEMPKTDQNQSMIGEVTTKTEESTSEISNSSTNQLKLSGDFDAFVVDMNIFKKKGKLNSIKNRRIKFENDFILFYGPNRGQSPRSYHCSEILYKPLKPVQESLKVVINLQQNTADEIALHLFFKKDDEPYIHSVVDRFNMFIEENKDKMEPKVIPYCSLVVENSIRRNYPDFQRQKTPEMSKINQNQSIIEEVLPKTEESTSEISNSSFSNQLKSSGDFDMFTSNVNVIKIKGPMTHLENRRISFEKDSIQFHAPNTGEPPRTYHCSKILYKPLKPVQGSLKVVINLLENTNDEFALHLIFPRHFEQFIELVIERFNNFIEENKDKMKTVKIKPFVPLNARNSNPEFQSQASSEMPRNNQNQSIIGEVAPKNEGSTLEISNSSSSNVSNNSEEALSNQLKSSSESSDIQIDKNRSKRSASKSPGRPKKVSPNADPVSQNWSESSSLTEAFGRSDESLNRFLSRRMIVWGPEVTQILDEGSLLAEIVKNPENSGFRTVVLTGPPNTGKTFLAAQIAKSSDFPFVKVISPEDTVGFSESAKCMALKKAFEDAKRSKLSVLLIDNLERLIDYHPVGPHFNNMVFQALLVLLNASLPAGHRLLVIATSSDRSFLRDMGLMDVFGRVIDIPRLSTADQMMNVIQESNIYTDDQLVHVRKPIRIIFQIQKFEICIKNLLELIESARQYEAEDRVDLLIDMIKKVAFN